jgi:hypothetical protein
MAQTAWFLFQEEISEYFKSLGFETETNKTLEGIRTNHDIDVLVKTKFMGRDLVWIVEAKKWNKKVNKLQVFGLRAILDDIGADKGFVISEKGFQKGAKEAAEKTNIELLTFDELKQETKDFVEQDILIHFEERISILWRRYGAHKKGIREYYDLKLKHGDGQYSVFVVLSTATETIKEALNRSYPINLSGNLDSVDGELQANNLQQLINWLNLNLNIVDRKILEAEIKMQKDGNFNPILK